MDATGRRLRLLAHLQARPGVTAAALAQGLETSPRAIRRDVARLRELGYRIEATPGRHGGYRLAVGQTLPPLVLDDDEAVAVGLGLRLAATAGVSEVAEAGVTALAKLEDGLPSRLRARVAAAGTVAVPGGRTVPSVSATVLAACALACRAREALWLTHRSGGRAAARGRDVQPHRLVWLAARWYLVAYDVRARAWRSFRLDRVVDARPTATRWPAPTPPADPAAFAARGLAADAWPRRAVVRLFMDLDTARTLVDPTLGTLHPDPDGCRLEIGTDDLDWAARRVAGLGLDLEVVGPPAFGRALASLGRWLQDVGDAADDPGAGTASASAGSS